MDLVPRIHAHPGDAEDAHFQLPKGTGCGKVQEWIRVTPQTLSSLEQKLGIPDTHLELG